MPRGSKRIKLNRIAFLVYRIITLALHVSTLSLHPFLFSHLTACLLT